jgi:hypothetical protein
LDRFFPSNKVQLNQIERPLINIDDFQGNAQLKKLENIASCPTKLKIIGGAPMTIDEYINFLI